ncbi:MAG TPA: ABC transporter permease [Bacteroidetes bacterium]|nr:ABC transporter permease [Bacteroidota bacterium]
MRTILVIIRKEFLQIFRNRAMLPQLIMMPIIQLLILSNAATFEIKHLNIHVIDNDQSETSRRLIGKFKASNYFELKDFSFDEKHAEEDIMQGEDRAILIIQKGFEHDLIKEQHSKVLLNINAIDGAAAGVINTYALNIIQDFNRQIDAEWVNRQQFDFQKSINTPYSLWYNPFMNYKTFMVPGLIVMLLTMVGMFMSAQNVVREKEVGTIEQINVTPIRKWHFIVGKQVPFLIIGIFQLTLGLTIARWVFGIHILGSLPLIYLFAFVYLFALLCLGLLISTAVDTQQQAMFLAWFFMVIFILMSGLFTPIEGMPHWAQQITKFNPIAYFVAVMRMVMLKGSTLMDILPHLLSILSGGIVLAILATARYRKRA